MCFSVRDGRESRHARVFCGSGTSEEQIRSVKPRRRAINTVIND